MSKRGIVGLGMMALASCAFLAGCASEKARQPWTEAYSAGGILPSSGDAGLAAILAEQCRRAKVPAMSAAVLTSEGLQSVAVAGFRKWGDATQATLDDLWHLGSDTKVMTAVLAATFVEEGKLRWDSSILEVFPELAPSIDPGYRRVTLTELLSHRSGLPANPDYGRLEKAGSVREQRLVALREAFSKKPAYIPGSEFLYSNLGYIVVGAMIERVGGADWETLMKRRVFDPLGMVSAGFGGLGAPGGVDQPWGHRKLGKAPANDGADIDNPPVLGPAGRVHCSIRDWGKFIADQLRGARNEAGLLKPESYRELQSAHFPPAAVEPKDYSFGWAIMYRDWAGGRTFTHSGSNTYYFATAWVAPERDFAVLVCANSGSGAAAVDAAIAGIIATRLTRERNSK
jgi:CubicO group peptidase (beta-lactamase class C family)